MMKIAPAVCLIIELIVLWFVVFHRRKRHVPDTKQYSKYERLAQYDIRKGRYNAMQRRKRESYDQLIDEVSSRNAKQKRTINLP